MLWRDRMRTLAQSAKSLVRKSFLNICTNKMHTNKLTAKLWVIICLWLFCGKFLILWKIFVQHKHRSFEYFFGRKYIWPNLRIYLMSVSGWLGWEFGLITFQLSVGFLTRNLKHRSNLTTLFVAVLRLSERKLKVDLDFSENRLVLLWKRQTDARVYWHYLCLVDGT